MSRWGPRREQELSMAVIVGVLAFVLGVPWWLALGAAVAIEVTIVMTGIRSADPRAGDDPRVEHPPTLHDWSARGPWRAPPH